MNFSFAAITTACLAVAACGTQGGPITPQAPPEVVLDQMDATILAASSEQAPSFDQVASPRSETPRRFRAWLGWTRTTCVPCPPDQTAVCSPVCTPGTPFVCTRPARTIACHDDEIVSTSVTNAEDPVPAAGVYVFEGLWSSEGAGDGAFAVTRISPLRVEPAAQ